jgi:hypothetical protein
MHASNNTTGRFHARHYCRHSHGSRPVVVGLRSRWRSHDARAAAGAFIRTTGDTFELNSFNRFNTAVTPAKEAIAWAHMR